MARRRLCRQPFAHALRRQDANMLPRQGERLLKDVECAQSLSGILASACEPFDQC
jgi:hypothetical protein